MEETGLNLLKDLMKISSPSGDEAPMRDFLISHFHNNLAVFKEKPKLYSGQGFENGLIVKIGQPRTAIFAHMDTVGFMVGYGNDLLETGCPQLEEGLPLKGIGKQADVRCKLKMLDKRSPGHDNPHPLPRATQLVFNKEIEIQDGTVTSAYLDNRIGIWNSLMLAAQLQDILLVFTCREEHNGGHAGAMGRFIYEELQISQALISDITWTTEGIKHGDGAVISVRDADIPRRENVNKIIELAEGSGIPFQLELESVGGSDGNELQRSPYPIDWCFVGAPCSNMHSPNESMLVKDIMAMHNLYKWLLPRL